MFCSKFSLNMFLKMHKDDYEKAYFFFAKKAEIQIVNLSEHNSANIIIKYSSYTLI